MGVLLLYLNWHIMNLLLEIAGMFRVLDTVYPLILRHDISFFLFFSFFFS